MDHDKNRMQLVYDNKRTQLMGDQDVPFSIASAQEALKEICELLPKAKKAQAFGAVNEVMLTLSEAQSLIHESEYKK